MKYAGLIVLALLMPMAAPAALRADPPEAVNLRKTVTVEVAARVKGAVVNVSATKLINRAVTPFANDPFFQMYGSGEVVKVPANSLGSGFIVHPDGYIVTNNHVIDRARQITVELEDGRKLPADLVSADAENDLAILKISDKQPFPTVPLGDSSDLMIGEPVIAIGNPMGYSHSVSTGIVSALHRDLKGPQDKVMFANLIQTDAAINPGNSGGPLLNAYGQVIAINTAIRSDAQNIGFAIPVNRLRDLIPELMNPATVAKIEVPLTLSERRTITPPANISLDVLAGEKDPKVVASIDGKKPADIVDACAMLLRAKVGQAIEVKFADGSSEKIEPKAVPTSGAIAAAKDKLGITVEMMTPMLAEKNHLSQEDGLLVTAVAKDSIADRSGLQPGDIIVQLGRFRVATLDDLGALLDRLPSKGLVRIAVIRENQLEAGELEMDKE